jgi:hypothetical protein
VGEQIGEQTHLPPEQKVLPPQEPQLPPQPSSPHTAPVVEQLGVHTQAPAWQVGVGALQVPQLPPQPSSPHTAPVMEQLGTQTQAPDWQVGVGALQLPQLPPQPSSPHTAPVIAQLGAQPTTHVPAVGAPEQTRAPVQVPQLPPQPSSPQGTMPVQRGVQLGQGAPGKKVMSPVESQSPVAEHAHVPETAQSDDMLGGAESQLVATKVDPEQDTTTLGAEQQVVKVAGQTGLVLVSMQSPVGSHVWRRLGQAPLTPVPQKPPQPSPPHCLPEQSGIQPGVAGAGQARAFTIEGSALK